MRVATKDEAAAVYALYEAMTDVVTTTELERQMIVSVLLKITATLALAEKWSRDELLNAFGYTYDMEKFLTPSSKEKH